MPRHDRDRSRWSAIPRSSVLLAVVVCVVGRQDVQARDVADSMRLLVQTIDGIEDPNVIRSLLKGMLAGLEGRRGIEAPEGWGALGAKLEAHSDERVRELSMELSQIFGDQEAVQRALLLVSNTAAPAEQRRKMLRSLLSQKNQEASQLLVGLLDEPELELDAVRGFAIVENSSGPSVLLGHYADMSTDIRRAVVETLATRKSYAISLLAAVKEGTVDRDDIPTHVARSLSGLLGDDYVAVFGEPPKLGADREKQIAKFKAQLTPNALAQASESSGRVVFEKTCAACHTLYGSGGKIGPDLTGSNRANLDYILLNSVDPSYDVPGAYRMVTIVTVDGRVVNGIVAEEDASRVVLKTVEQPRLVIAKADIDERVVSKQSMMPEGQLQKLGRRSVADLIKYLRTTEQVPLPE